jgi:hypothetical protein
VHELSLAAALDQSSMRQDLKMMRNRHWRYSAERGNFAAVDFLIVGDSLENQQPGSSASALEILSILAPSINAR